MHRPGRFTAEQLQRDAEFRRVVGIVHRDRRHDQRVAAELLADDRRLLLGLDFGQVQRGVHRDHLVHRNHADVVDGRELVIQQIRLQQRVDVGLTAQVDGRGDGPHGVLAVAVGDLFFDAVFWRRTAGQKTGQRDPLDAPHRVHVHP